MEVIHCTGGGSEGNVPEDKIVLNDPFHGFTIGKEAGHIFNPAGDQVIARTLDNELVGGVVYTAYSPNASCAMHMAAFNPRWITRDLMWVCFDYPFNQLKVKKIFAPVPSNNALALSMNERFGFKRKYLIEGVFEDADLVVMEMYREDCKWLDILPNRVKAGGGQDGR